MKHKKRGTFRVLDPRDGADLRLETSDGRESFSSAAQRMLIIDAHRVDWRNIGPRLDALLYAAAQSTFVFYRPWWPGTGAKVESFQKVFGMSSSDLAPAQFVAFSNSREVAQQTLRLAAKLGAGGGVWLCGSCSDPLLVERCVRATGVFADDTRFIAAECASHLGAALAIDEGARSILFVRVSEETVGLIEHILRDLSQLAECDPDEFS